MPSRQAKRLLPSGRRLLHSSFIAGTERYREEDLDEYLEPPRRALDLEMLDRVAGQAYVQFDPFDVALDAWLSVRVHRALPMSRAQAADPGVFRYLAIVRHPELVRHRWEMRSASAMLTRFWRPGARNDACAFSRWWWIGELTRDPLNGSYALTERIAASSPLTTLLFSRQLCAHRPMLVAAADELRDDADRDRTLKLAGKMLSTRLLEAMDAPELRTLLREARRHTSHEGRAEES